MSDTLQMLTQTEARKARPKVAGSVSTLPTAAAVQLSGAEVNANRYVRGSDVQGSGYGVDGRSSQFLIGCLLFGSGWACSNRLEDVT